MDVKLLDRGGRHLVKITSKERKNLFYKIQSCPSYQRSFEYFKIVLNEVNRSIKLVHQLFLPRPPSTSQEILKIIENVCGLLKSESRTLAEPLYQALALCNQDTKRAEVNELFKKRRRNQEFMRWSGASMLNTYVSLSQDEEITQEKFHVMNMAK